MQLTSGGTSLSSELFSSNGVLRGTDVMVHNNNIFLGTVTAVGAAGGAPAVQIYNTSASGKTVFVDGFDMYLSSAQNVELRIGGLGLTTAGATVKSLKGGGAAGLSHVRSQDTVPGSGITLANYAALPNVLVQVRFPFPVELPVDSSLSLVGATALSVLIANFYVREFTQ